MKRYKVIRIYLVSADNLSDAIEKVRADAAKYLESEFAKDADSGQDTGWGGALKNQFFGSKK